MSRMHDDRKDLYSREAVLTSSSSIRSVQTHPQNMEKEKVEKSSYGQHPFDTGFRTIDLMKPSNKPPQGRNIVPASLGSSQLHAMPPLMQSYISGAGHLINPVPINHGSLVRGSLSAGQHAFQTHIPVNIGAAAIAPPRGSVTMSHRSSLPSLKPSNLSNQIQLPLSQMPGLPTILPPNIANRTGSPIVSSHGLSTDSRLDSRAGMLSDSHHIRGNIQAGSQHAPQATIQVIASGTAVQPHIPTSYLSKGMTLGTAPNMLKIGVTNSNSSTSANAVSAFQLGIGKPYPGSSSVIIPATTCSAKSELQDLRHNAMAGATFSRFSTAHSVSLPNHHIQSHPVVTSNTANQPSSTINSVDARSHAVGVPFHSIPSAYVFHDMAHPIGLHNFPHLIRPPTTSVSAVPMFTIDSQRAIPAVPVVSIAVSSKGNIVVSDSHETVRSEGLTIHGNSTFNFPNIYPNLQATTFPPSFSGPGNVIDSSVRPGILRKRPADATTLFPVQPTEKERVTSPLKLDTNQTSLKQTKIISPPLKSEKVNDVSKPTNHSIVSITSDLKPDSTEESTANDVLATAATVASMLLSNSTSANHNVNSSNSLSEASPKKKPRKQLIITTEDVYGSSAPINSCTPDEDEEFLKANETMKDITPPKVSAAQLLLPSSNLTHQKQLFPQNSVTGDKMSVEVKQEPNELPPINGMIAPTADMKAADAMKYYIFRRRPQFGILSEYKVNTKAAHNHFYRRSDVRPKEDKKSSTNDRISNKSRADSLTGWRIHHLSTQLDDLVAAEKEICDEIIRCKDTIPLPTSSPTSNFQNETTQVSGEDLQLRLLHEVIQGNIQRCRYSIEQLDEAKETMFKLLDYKQKATDLAKKHKQKPKLKKKTS